MKFTDFTSVSSPRMTVDGYLVADVRCARTGCQVYLASEIGMIGDGTVTVYRPEEAVFAKDSIQTYAGKPVTLDHPPEMVTAENWKKYAIGDIGQDIMREGEYVRVSIKLMDASAIEAVKNGTRQISMGYTTPMEVVDGIAPDGTLYQAIQTGPIRINHLAVVDAARGGENLRIGDSADPWGVSPITASNQKETDMSDALTMVVLGDKAVKVTAADAQLIENYKAATAASIAQADKDYKSEIKMKQDEIEKLKGEIDGLKQKMPTADSLAKMVEDRVALVAAAAKISPNVSAKGLTDSALRRAVVEDHCGAESIAGKTDAYIDARFDVLIETAEPVKDALSGDLKQSTQSANAWGDKLFATAGVKLNKGA